MQPVHGLTWYEQKYCQMKKTKFSTVIAKGSWSPNSTDLYFWYSFVICQQTNTKDIAGQSAKQKGPSTKNCFNPHIFGNGNLDQQLKPKHLHRWVARQGYIASPQVCIIKSINSLIFNKTIVLFVNSDEWMMENSHLFNSNLIGFWAEFRSPVLKGNVPNFFIQRSVV